LPSTGGGLFLRPGLNKSTIGSASFSGGGFDLCAQKVDPNDAISDLAIIELDGPLEQAMFPMLPRVYTGGDFRDRVLNLFGAAPFLTGPILFTGALQSPVSILQGRITATPQYNHDCGFLGLGSCSPYWIAIDRVTGPTLGAPLVAVEQGDSGGPLTFQPMGDVPVIFGVASNTYSRFFVIDEDRFSPTWDNGSGNGAFIRQFYVDADEDGVDDRFDNAPPSLCPDNPFRCANPDQKDDDHDGIGDVADNCPPSVCERRNMSPEACANRAQFDADKDGTGDACDSCVLIANGRAALGGDAFRGNASQYDDADGDGVGDACDSCHDVPNPFRACTPSAGCDLTTGACTSADCSSGACVGANHLGRCHVSGDSCTSTLACPETSPGLHEACDIGFGRCTLQNDDPDNDGLGNACDACPLDTEVRINANSNIDAERVRNVAKLGDHCDPVPQLVSRGIVGRRALTGPAVATDPRASTTGYTTFFGTAGIGVGATPSAVTETAGFRRCECVRPGPAGLVTLTRDECVAITGGCAPAADSFDRNLTYRMISTATSTDITRKPVSPVTLGETFVRTFTGDIQCDVALPSRSFPEICRVGAQRHITLWDHSTDIEAGRVRTNGGEALGAITAGLVMSHVLGATGITTSARDAANPGLRDTLEYVKTPLVDFVAGTATQQFEDCIGAGCMMTYRPDWAVYPPDGYRATPTPLEMVGFYGRFAPQPGSAIVVLGRSTDSAFDVASSLDSDVAAVIHSRSFTFLTPVEDGISGARGAARIASIAAIPRSWKQSAERPVAFVSNAGQLQLFGHQNSSRSARLAPPSAPSSPFGDVRFIPSDRDGSRSVFSGAEQAIYMVGGHRAAGDATGEVWRYDISGDVWTHQFVGERNGTLPGDVRAIAYDNTSGRIVIIDDGIGQGPPLGRAGGKGPLASGPPGPRFGRIVVIDTIGHTIRAVATLPRTDKYARIGLVHRGGGEYLLVRTEKNQHSFVASAFRFTADGSIEWIGKRQGDGEMLDDPFRTPQGILLPVAKSGAHDLVYVKTDSGHDAPGDL
jgi:hypothetical protein